MSGPVLPRNVRLSSAVRTAAAAQRHRLGHALVLALALAPAASGRVLHSRHGRPLPNRDQSPRCHRLCAAPDATDASASCALPDAEKMRPETRPVARCVARCAATALLGRRAVVSDGVGVLVSVVSRRAYTTDTKREARPEPSSPSPSSSSAQPPLPPPPTSSSGRPTEEDNIKDAGRAAPVGPGASPDGVPPNAFFYPVPQQNSLRDAAMTGFIGLGLVFIGGIAYLAWYKKRVLDKIEAAFAPGYDPALELATHATVQRAGPGAGASAVSPARREGDQAGADLVDENVDEPTMRRREQDRIDRIVHGGEWGRYFVLLGPKGTGKTTMIFSAMQANNAEGIAMCDAHPDLEVFRLRLGKALNFEYNEDSQTGLFQRRDPREGGPALDIERAMNKLEKVALRSARRTGRPLVLIINNIHHFKNDDEGKNFLLQLQQRAESWAASGILTVVFSSDDFWPVNVLRRGGSRMHVLSITDLDRGEALRAAARIRAKHRSARASRHGGSTGTSHSDAAAELEEEEATTKEAIALVGGRLAYLNKVCRADDVVHTAQYLKEVEKAWLLSQIGLIPDCDDDVMDEQKWSSCSWLLLREFVKLRQEGEGALEQEGEDRAIDDLPLPSIPYWKCRQIMTRPDFLEELDRLNIISIDVRLNVRPDSMLILHAARDVVEEEGFDELLDSVRGRVDEIESLHRTRELTFKDVPEGGRVWVSVDKGSGPRLVDS